MKKASKKTFRFIRKFVYKCSEDYVTIHAAYSGLFLFMSFFPMIMFVLLLLSSIHVSRVYLTEELYQVIPEIFHELVTGIIDHLAESSSNFLFSASILLWIFSASSGVYGLMLGLNDVYRTYDRRNYFVQRAISMLYMFFFVLMIVLSLVFVVFENRLSTLITGRFPNTAEIIAKIRQYDYPVLFLVMTLIFNLMYKALPNLKLKFFEQLPGAAAASLGWMLLSYGFSIYVNSSSRISLYGSLTSFILFLFWLWLAMCIIFIGGEINAVIHDKKYGPATDLRKRNLEEIRSTENAIRKSGRLTSRDRKYLRRSSTRKVDSARIEAELKDTPPKTDSPSDSPSDSSSGTGPDD